MPTTRQYVRRPHRTRLTSDQELSFWMGEGPLGNPQPFASPAARRDAWERHKHRLIGTLPSSPGRRPMAWWQYDAAIRWPGYDRERSTLWQAGLLLGDDERAALEAEWRREFDVAAQRLPAGERRAAHYAWADIPEELVRRWTLAATKKKAPASNRGQRSRGQHRAAIAPVQEVSTDVEALPDRRQ